MARMFNDVSGRPYKGDPLNADSVTPGSIVLRIVSLAYASAEMMLAPAGAAVSSVIRASEQSERTVLRLDISGTPCNMDLGQRITGDAAGRPMRRDVLVQGAGTRHRTPGPVPKS